MPATVPATRIRSWWPVTHSLLPGPRMARAAGERRAGTAPAGAPLMARGEASALTGNAGAGAAAVSAAYCCGSTMMTGNCRPWPDVPVTTDTVADRWAPGTPVIRCWAARVIPGPTAGAVSEIGRASCRERGEISVVAV